MVTWPISADQFDNERFVNENLKIGTGVGVIEWVKEHCDHVTSESIEKAINRLMTGEEAEGGAEQESWKRWQEKLVKMADHLTVISILWLKN